jgi:hypothetical protein
MLLEIECSDTQPGDFQRLILIPLFFFRFTKKDKTPSVDEFATLRSAFDKHKKHPRQRPASALSKAPNRNENTDPTDTRVPDLQQ